MLGDFRLLLLLMVLLVVVVVVALVLLLVVVEMVLLQLVAAGVLSRSGLLTLFRSFCFPFDDACGFKERLKVTGSTSGHSGFPHMYSVPLNSAASSLPRASPGGMSSVVSVIIFRDLRKMRL